MNRILKIKALLFSLLLLGSTLFVQSQPAERGIKTGLAQANDPIVEMLDSLVTLNNVIRFNCSSGGSEQACSDKSNFEVPYFSDEVYTRRISSLSTPIPLTYNDEVKKYIDVYAFKKRELTKRVLGLKDLYFPMFEEVLDKEELPIELKYLAIVESALNPIAKSRVGATGIWQFMYNTGKIYNLKINSYIDERRDPLKATHAACQYFKDMYDIYKDWLLVIAAYNCGAGNVNRAIIRAGGKTDFWDISPFLPRETRGYVPAFIAATYVMHYAAEHKLQAVTPAFSYFEVDTLRIERKASLRSIAEQVNLPYEVISYLNPIYKKGVIPASDQPQIVRLPSNKIIAFLSAEDKIFLPEPQEKAPVLARLNIADPSDDDGSFSYVYKKIKKTHTVRGGETLSRIANKYDCSVAEIKKLNRLKSTRLTKGQKLKVYAMQRVKEPVKVKETLAVKSDIADSAINETANTSQAVLNDTNPNISSDTALASSGVESGNETPASEKYIYHHVQRGDTLWNIAIRYEGATVEQIIELNKLSNPRVLKTGSKLKVKIAG
ncbi:MAG: LysM peptidoglycan-binding domain-containing protein [Bacteroidia bacterium]